MIRSLKLRALYALHILAPLPFVFWHVERMAPDTLAALARLFTH